jgi:hypothetical protein
LTALQQRLVSGAAIPKSDRVASHVFVDTSRINAQGLREVLSAVPYKDCLFVVLYGRLQVAYKHAWHIQHYFKTKGEGLFDSKFDIVLQLQQGLTDLSSHKCIGVSVWVMQV